MARAGTRVRRGRGWSVIVDRQHGRYNLPAILVIAALGAGLLLRFPPGQYGFYPRCPVRALTGLLCPGCGGTRALAALLRGHLGEALGCNALVTFSSLLLGPAFVLYGIAAGMWPERISRGSMDGWQQPLGMAALTVAVLFTVWRNFV